MPTEKLKVVIINTAETKGGAAVACNRLHIGLNELGVNSKMLVRHKSSSDESVFEFTKSKWSMRWNLFQFYVELFFLKFFKTKNYDFSIPYFGPKLEHHPLIKDADVVHIHWAQNSYLNLSTLENLKKLNKPIVWTLHDMWAFTGGCHYNQSCRKFETECSQCPQLKNQHLIDLSNWIFKQKQNIYSDKFHIVTPSNWLSAEAKKSKLFSNNNISTIPYNIDFNLFKPQEKKSSKEYFGINPEKKIILFVSMNVEDPRKGFDYLRKAIIELEQSIPNWREQYEVLAIGRNNDDQYFETKIHFTGRLSSFDIISKAYSAADVFVAPSVQDNLPNTVIESLSCGTPVVAFNIGGMPDMIEHNYNGSLAEFGNIEALSKGILDCLTKDFRNNCIESAQRKFSTKKEVQKYIDLYSQLIESCPSN